VSNNLEIIIPTRYGKDLQNAVQAKDAHVRIETYRQIGTNLFIDVFDSAIEDPNEAHLVSEAFPWSDQGADEATRFLQEHGFHVALMIK
jgi:hypothetical protein